MAEYIEREALINKMRVMPIPEQAGRFNTWLDNCALGVNAAIKTVANFPAADVTPVRYGTWIKRGEDSWECSECHSENCYAYDKNLKRFTDLYCPNCGAKMDGEKGEQE